MTKKKKTRKSGGTSYLEHKRGKIIIDYLFYTVITEQLDGYPAGYVPHTPSATPRIANVHHATPQRCVSSVYNFRAKKKTL